MQKGTIVRRSNRWYVRYWERRNIGGVVEQKRVSHCLGDVSTRGKRPPADIVNAAKDHMATAGRSKIPAAHITTIGQFVDKVYLPYVKTNKRPSTAVGYGELWRGHLKPLCGDRWMKDVRTFDVQQWLSSIAEKGLSRNSLKHLKSLLSAIFKHAKQQGYFDGQNPVVDTAVNPHAAEPEEGYAYSFEEITGILTHIPEPAATAFSVAAFTGLRIGEIQGLDWEDFRDGEIHVSRSVWRGHETDPKTRKSKAPVPVIRQLSERLEMHRLRNGNSKTGPMFATGKKTRHIMNNLLQRTILPALNRCEVCNKSEDDHADANHDYKRDARLPEWHGWHACRRGLGSNLYRLGVPDMVIQRILRHANVSTTTGYYIKTAADDVRGAMAKLETDLDTSWTPATASSKPI